MILKPGARVWYWARHAGEAAHKKRGQVIQTDGTYARVRLDEGTVPVQTVEVKRLQLEEKETT